MSQGVYGSGVMSVGVTGLWIGVKGIWNSMVMGQGLMVCDNWTPNPLITTIGGSPITLSRYLPPRSPSPYEIGS